MAGQPFGRDVRERPGHVADVRQRVGFVELSKAEVKQLDRDLVRVFDEHVRRLHVAVDDPARMRMGEAVEHLRGRFDRVAVVDRRVAKRLAQRPAGHVLVGDVDMSFVAAEVV